MDTNKLINIATKLINKHTPEKQIIKTLEELSELQKEICKFLLYRESRHISTIVEEMVDVQIMLLQLEMIVLHISENKNIVKDQWEFKINKIEKMLEENQNA